MRGGKIGIFDSGLGGLLILRSLVKKLPAYDYIYLGDTKRVPYGNRSHDVIYQFLEEGVDFLLREGCELVIVACNTASATALRKIQRGYLSKHPNKKVLGVIIPAAEASKGAKKVGVLGTEATVRSKAFVRELKKIGKDIEVYQQAAPLLVPLIEQGKARESLVFLGEYLAPLLEKGVDTIILGCTHYGLLREEIRGIAGPEITIISEDEILADKLSAYLARHPKIEEKISRRKERRLLVTALNPYYKEVAGRWFGEKTGLQVADLKPIPPR